VGVNLRPLRLETPWTSEEKSDIRGIFGFSFGKCYCFY